MTRKGARVATCRLTDAESELLDALVEHYRSNVTAIIEEALAEAVVPDFKHSMAHYLARLETCERYAMRRISASVSPVLYLTAMRQAATLQTTLANFIRAAILRFGGTYARNADSSAGRGAAAMPVVRRK